MPGLTAGFLGRYAGAVRLARQPVLQGDSMTGLFLSMLPLHADRPDRQQAFVANALRLWRELDA